MKRFLILIVIFGAVYSLKAQQTCTQRLNQAEDDYEAGRLLRIPEQINSCLEIGGFTEEEEIRARKLLTLVYIFTDKEGLAEGALVQLLKADPEHILDPRTDPAELFFLYKQFRVDPIFRLAVRGGLNSSSPQVIREFSTNDNPKFYNGKTTVGEKEYEVDGTNYAAISGMGIGFWGELLIERHLFKGIEAAVGPQFRITKYHVEDPGDNLAIVSIWTNQQVYLRAPLLVRYTFNYQRRDKRILPYLFAGASGDYLLAARYLEAKREKGSPYVMPESDGDLKASEQVNLFNYSYFGGVGAKVRLATHFLTIEARFDSNRMNYINGENRLSNPAATIDAGIAEDDLSLNAISISIGYTCSIYSPRKILSR